MERLRETIDARGKTLRPGDTVVRAVMGGRLREDVVTEIVKHDKPPGWISVRLRDGMPMKPDQVARVI